MRGNLYSIRDLDEKLTETFKELYQQKEKTMKKFSNSDFYEIKHYDPCLSPEINELICNFITSSASTDFNILLEFFCREECRTHVPNNLDFFTLKKLLKNDFVFGIEYKNMFDKTLPHKQKKIFLKEKQLKYLLNCLFKVILGLKNLNSNLNGINHFFFMSKYKFRFMIFDSEFCVNNIIDLPDKRLMRRFKYLLGRSKPEVSTKFKLSGKLPGSLPINDVQSILKNSFNMFSKLYKSYGIKAALRFENDFPKSDEGKNFNLKTFTNGNIRNLFSKDLVLNSKLLSVNEYSSGYECTSEGSIELPGFFKKIKISFSWRNKVYYIQFYHKETDENTKKYILNFSLDNIDAVEFEILSDRDLNIIKIVENYKKKIITQDVVEPTNYKHEIEKILNAVTRWL